MKKHEHRNFGDRHGRFHHEGGHGEFGGEHMPGGFGRGFGGPGGFGGHGRPGGPGGPGRFGGPGGGPGGHGRRGERMERGALRFVLLDALRDGPKHGYEIIKSLEERTHGQWVPSAGAVYPALQYLNDLDLVRDYPEGDRRVYELTPAGRTELETQADRVEAFWSRFAAEAPSASSQHEVEFLQEEMGELFKTIWRGLHTAIGAGDRESIRKVRAVIERSRSEIRDLIADAASAPGAAQE